MIFIAFRLLALHSRARAVFAAGGRKSCETGGQSVRRQGRYAPRDLGVRRARRVEHRVRRAGPPLDGRELTSKPGLEQPIYFWTPSVAPSGMTFYTGDLFIATMAPRIGRKVVRLVLQETPQGWRVAGEEWLLTELDGMRFREVKQGPDGALYAMSDARTPAGDKIYRIVPK